MNFAVQRLNESARATVVAHLLALPMNDRRLRFCGSVAAPVITAYVDRIDFGHDAVFGVHDDRFALIGVAHLALVDGFAELGLSVLPPHHCLGVGSALFKRAVAHARNRSVPRIFMHCLADNEPIMHIARKFGMNIVARAGEADAHLALAPASIAPIAAKFVTDPFTPYDDALDALDAAWKQRRRAGT